MKLFLIHPQYKKYTVLSILGINSATLLKHEGLGSGFESFEVITFILNLYKIHIVRVMGNAEQEIKPNILFRLSLHTFSPKRSY